MSAVAEHGSDTRMIDEAAEQATLGALILNAEALDRVLDLRADHFAFAHHQHIFSAITTLVGRGVPVDPISLDAELALRGKSGLCGGLAYLAELAANVPGVSNIKRYAELVRDKATLRALVAASEEIRELAASPAPVREVLSNAQSAVMRITEAEVKRGARKVSEALNSKLDELSERHSGVKRGLPTGLADLDEKLGGGMCDGDLIVVAGRPSMGKTALAMQCAYNVALGGTPVGVFSMEMSESQLLDRAIAAVGRIDLKRILRGQVFDDGVAEHFKSAMYRLNEAPLYIDESGGLSHHELAARARSMVRKWGIRLIVIDYLQLMEKDERNLVGSLGQITCGLKALAKDLKLPIVVLSQLSRKVEERPNKRPLMSDLRDSGAIEQDADVILMVYRDEYYNADSPDRGIAEGILAKNRQGERTTVPLAFIGEHVRFADLSRDWSPQQQEEKKPSRGFPG